MRTPNQLLKTQAYSWTARRSSLGKGVWLFACISVARNLGGCATLYEGVTSSQQIHFSSEPAGAQISFSADAETCVAPCNIVLRKAKDQVVQAKLDGYEEQRQAFKRSLAYTFWGNFAFFTLAPLGMAIDWFDGYMWTYRQKAVHFKFADAAPPPPAPPPHDELPPTAALARLKERFPEDYMAQQIRYYYGEPPADERQAILTRLYKIMLDMQSSGDEVDADEAIRRDYAGQLDPPLSP